MHASKSFQPYLHSRILLHPSSFGIQLSSASGLSNYNSFTSAIYPLQITQRGRREMPHSRPCWASLLQLISVLKLLPMASNSSRLRARTASVISAKLRCTSAGRSARMLLRLARCLSPSSIVAKAASVASRQVSMAREQRSMSTSKASIRAWRLNVGLVLVKWITRGRLFSCGMLICVNWDMLNAV